MNPDHHFAALAEAAQGISQSEFESVALGLSPSEARLFEYLRDRGASSTISIRQDCAIGNVSQAATLLNLKLQRRHEPYRVVCELRPLINRFGSRGVIGWWHLTDSGTDAA